MAFNYHPAHPRSNDDVGRTNLYDLETSNMGRTWRTVHGKDISIPLVGVHNESLVRDYKAEGLLVYLMDLNYDAQGRPVTLFLTSRGAAAGAQSDPCTWATA